MQRSVVVLLFAFAITACSAYEKGEVVASSPDEIRIAIAYDAAIDGVDTRRQAAEHCAETDRRAVWYGHDRDGNMHYKCQQ